MVVRERQTDHPAPVVDDESEARDEAEVVQETLEIRDATVEDVLVAIVAGLVREAAADVIGDDRAE